MNQSEYIEMIIKDLNIITMELIEEHNIPLYMPLEKCISSSNIEDLYLKNEYSIYDQLDGAYKKELKNLFNDLKKINFLGNPKLFYYKDNTIKITSDILDVLWFHGDKDSIYFIINTYLNNLKKYLEQLEFIKFVQYIVDIPNLKLDIGEPKLTIDDKGIKITYPFARFNMDFLIKEIKSKLEDKKMEIMSSVLLLRHTENDIYIPQKYEDYDIPEIFKCCLSNFYIESINQVKYVKVFFEGKFVNISYLSAYEFMNNKTNKPYCYFYTKNNQLLDMKIQNKINKILRIQDSLE